MNRPAGPLADGLAAFISGLHRDADSGKDLGAVAAARAAVLLGFDAAKSGQTIAEPDLTTATRWPAFQHAALSTHARAVTAKPLRLGAITVGVLAGYSRTTGPLSPEHLHTVDRFARAALRLLLQTPLDPRTTARPGLALHRAEVHQAAGVLSVQLGLPLGDALIRLRAHAYANDRDLLGVARDIIAHRISMA